VSRSRLFVVMAVCSGARYVGLTIDSVLSQDFRDLESVIVDDASTDETPAIISSCRHDSSYTLRNAKQVRRPKSVGQS